MRIVKGIGEVYGAVKEEFSGHEGVRVETFFQDLGVDLFEGFESFAVG